MTCLLFHVNSVEVPYLIKRPPVRSLYEICEEDSADADKAPLGERVPAARRCAEDERTILGPGYASALRIRRVRSAEVGAEVAGMVRREKDYDRDALLLRVNVRDLPKLLRVRSELNPQVCVGKVNAIVARERIAPIPKECDNWRQFWRRCGWREEKTAGDGRARAVTVGVVRCDRVTCGRIVRDARKKPVSHKVRPGSVVRPRASVIRRQILGRAHAGRGMQRRRGRAVVEPLRELKVEGRVNLERTL